MHTGFIYTPRARDAIGYLGCLPGCLDRARILQTDAELQNISFLAGVSRSTPLTHISIKTILRCPTIPKRPTALNWSCSS